VIIRLVIFATVCSILLWSERPKLMLLKNYKDQNITGWVMSEKLDGIRAYWNGKNLLTRSGKIIHAPKWFTKDYPPFPVDGELWSKRGDFENISSIVRDKTPSQKWKEIKHYIFEVPKAEGGLFERLSKVKAYESNIIKIIPQIQIENKTRMRNYLKEVESKGGEGIVVRDPQAPYISQRTDRVLKVKSFYYGDCEVVGYREGRGKFKGLMGSVECKLDNNITFRIGSGFNLKERKKPPSIGDIIRFKYRGLTKYGKPRFSVYVRERR
jgi:DNA ligase-1